MTTPESPSPSPRPALPKAPLVLLGLLTLASFVGPFVIYMTIRGGPRDYWPPDRPVEWVTVVGVTSMVMGLMIACVTSGRWAGATKKP